MRADQLRDLLALDLEPEKFHAVVEIMSRRSAGAIRQAKYEKNKKSSDVRSDVSTDVIGEPIGGVVLKFEERKKKTSPTPSVSSDAQEFFDAYNVCARELGWTEAKKLDRRRGAAIRRCISDAGGLGKAFDHLNDFANSKYAREYGAGKNEAEWTININYVIRPAKWIEIMEGKFNGVRAQG